MASRPPLLPPTIGRRASSSCRASDALARDDGCGRPRRPPPKAPHSSVSMPPAEQGASTTGHQRPGRRDKPQPGAPSQGSEQDQSSSVRATCASRASLASVGVSVSVARCQCIAGCQLSRTEHSPPGSLACQEIMVRASSPDDRVWSSCALLVSPARRLPATMRGCWLSRRLVTAQQKTNRASQKRLVSSCTSTLFALLDPMRSRRSDDTRKVLNPPIMGTEHSGAG